MVWIYGCFWWSSNKVQVIIINFHHCWAQQNQNYSRIRDRGNFITIPERICPGNDRLCEGSVGLDSIQLNQEELGLSEHKNVQQKLKTIESKTEQSELFSH
jgi:hypothetical protein